MLRRWTPRKSRSPERGFTAIELCISILIILIIVAIALPAMQPRRHGGSRQLKDSTQVRGIVQSMVIWAQNNNGKYPLPSEIDAQGFTLPGEAHTKDTTGHVLSVLIYNGNIMSELCVSPAEANNGQVVIDYRYEFDKPKAAADPEKALWDPRFRGTPLDAPVGDRAAGSPANNSYAQLVNIGARREQWNDLFKTTEAVFGNRGPAYAAEDSAPHPQSGKWKLLDGPLGRDSNTLLIHGGRTTWEGNIAYNDGHVSFETGPAPDGVAYSRGGDPKKLNTPDNLFVNESDETDGDTSPGSLDKGRNAYLRPIAGYTAPGKPILWRD